MNKIYKTSKPFKKITEKEKQLMVDMYNNNISIINISKELNRDRVSIRKHLNFILGKEKNKIRKNIILNKYSKSVLELHIKHPANYISNYLKIPLSIVETVLKINNIKRQHNKKYSFNENYFDNIDTPNKAYFLGLLYADGCLVSNKNTIQLVLKTEDKILLEALNKDINSNRPLSYEKPHLITNTNYISSGAYSLCLDSKITRNALEKIGLTPKKSLSLSYPNLEKSLQSHFIRGYFDGDGCISKINKNYICNVQILSTLNFLTELKNQILHLNLNVKINIEKRNNRIYILSINNREDCINFSNFLYKNADIYLKRKKDKFEDWKNLNYDKRKEKRNINS